MSKLGTGGMVSSRRRCRVKVYGEKGASSPWGVTVAAFSSRDGPGAVGPGAGPASGIVAGRRGTSSVDVGGGSTLGAFSGWVSMVASGCAVGAVGLVRLGGHFTSSLKILVLFNGAVRCSGGLSSSLAI